MTYLARNRVKKTPVQFSNNHPLLHVLPAWINNKVLRNVELLQALTGFGQTTLRNLATRWTHLCKR